jgi:hypothetical protein
LSEPEVPYEAGMQLDRHIELMANDRKGRESGRTRSGKEDKFKKEIRRTNCLDSCNQIWSRQSGGEDKEAGGGRNR